MENYVPTSDLDESQATQLIHNVLAVSESSAHSSGAAHCNKPDDSVVIIESSADSSSIGCSTRTLSHYHLHGLAQTQDDVLNEGSQKENIINGGGGSNTRDSAVHHSTKITRTKGRRQEHLGLSHSRTKEVRSRLKLDESLKNSSLHHNPSMQSNSRNSKPPSRQRSSSELSQDSFAGDAIDPEQHFLSSARQFQVPLSELARPSGSGQRPSAEDNSKSSMSLRRPLVYGQNRHHEEQKDGDTIMIDEETNSQNSIASSSGPGSSMYERRDEENVQNEIQATQPTTPSDEAESNGSGGSDPPWLLAAARASITAIVGNSPTPPSATNPDEVKSNSSGGRSLLSMIHPKNKWRFQKYHNFTEAQDPRSSDPRGSNVTVPGTSAVQETQFYPDDVTALSFQRSFQIPSSDLLSFPDQREQRRAGTFKDPMDEVPDSEPSREEPPPAVDVPATDGKTTRHSRMPQGIVQQKKLTSVTRTDGQDDDSDDGDVPLAKTSTLFERKGKEREPDQVQKVVSRFARPRSKVQESAEIPSSVPEQDVAPPVRGLRSVKNDERTKRTEENSTRKVEKTHAGSSRRIVRRVNDEEVEESKSESEQVQKTEGEESDEIADDDYQDVGAQTSSRKRKRGVAPAKPPVTRRKAPITRTTVGTAKMAPPKQTKRPRSATASIIKMINMEPTRVFALWRQDGHFYSGTVHMVQPDSRFLVKFDDETEAIVSLEQMRSCELRAGDDVLLPNRTRSSKVVHLSKAGDNTVTVETDEDAEDVEMRSIRIASRTIKSAWKDRHLTVENIVPEVPIKASGSPAPSGVSLASAQSNRSMRRKFLSKTGLVVSLSAGNANWERDKELLISTVRNNGGTVLDDWSSVIKMEGKHTQHNNRWVLNRDEVQWIGRDVERVFLLADDSSQKPKFLMAVGLGIPCLSVNWLHDSISTGEEKEWSAYMLPQGYSDRLSARISQQVDVDWGNSVHQLTDIMDNAVPAKIFSDQSILCVGTDMVPQPKGKRLTGTDEKTQETSNAVARIIMCMGAHRVEAVAEPRYASVHLSDYDYIIVKESGTSALDIEGGTVVTWSWVKDCLIASRRLPLEDAISQEA